MSQPNLSPATPSVSPSPRGARAPLLGLCSFLGLPVGGAAGWLAGVANHGVIAGAGTTGVAIGVLAAAAVGLVASMASRVRQERWPWLGIVGAVVSTAPLALFIVSMLLHR
ncbi:hypothetical protein KQ945_10905 [Bacillus subtilis subsp. subtilis]|nr:hypothetical protein [Bacillus subtilis subsp. subtilis]